MVSELLREKLLQKLQEPVPDPDDDLDMTPPPPIDADKLAAIPKLGSLDEAADLCIDIHRNIELLEGLAELAVEADKLERLKAANGAKRCEHVKLNGKTCGSPALRGQQYCHYHGQAHAPVFELPVIEDQASLQIAFSRLAQQVMAEKVNAPQARLLLQILQSAARNLPVEEDTE